MVAKKEEDRDTADKNFETLLNRFGSRMKGHQAMMRFEKRRKRDDESIDRFLDNLESLRRRSDLEESTTRRNFTVASTFIDGLKSNDLRTMFAAYCTLSRGVETKIKRVYFNETKEVLVFGKQKHAKWWSKKKSSWYKPRDNMDKRRS